MSWPLLRPTLEGRLGRLIDALRQDSASLCRWLGLDTCDPPARLLREGDRWATQTLPATVARYPGLRRAFDARAGDADEVIHLACLSTTDLAEWVEKGADRLVHDMSTELRGAAAFYIDPALLDELDSLTTDALAWPLPSGGWEDQPVLPWLWPFPTSGPLGQALEWARTSAIGPAALGLGGGKTSHPATAIGLLPWVHQARERAAAVTGEPEWYLAALERQREMIGQVVADPQQVERLALRLMPYWDGALDGGLLHPHAATLLHLVESQLRTELRVDQSLAWRVIARNVRGVAFSDSFVAVAQEACRAALVHEKLSAGHEHEVAVERLARDAGRRLRSIADLVPLSVRDCETALADVLAGIGDTGTALARELRSGSGEGGPGASLFASARLNQPTGSPMVQWLARALWRDVVSSELDRLPHAALPYGVSRDLFAVRRAPAVIVRERDGEIEAVAQEGRGMVVARYAAIESTKIDSLRKGVDHMKRALVERVIRELNRTAHMQLLQGMNPFTRIVYERGFSGFSEAAGITSKRQRSQLRDLFEALQAYRGGRRDIPPALQFYMTPAAPGRPAQLRVDVGEAILPGYATTMKREGARTPDTWLLPTLEVPTLPRGIDKREVGACYDLQWELLHSFRGDLSALDEGWILAEHLPGATDRARVSQRTADLAVGHWTEQGGWLAARPGDRVTLAEDRALEVFRSARQDGRAKSARARSKSAARKRNRAKGRK